MGHCNDIFNKLPELISKDNAREIKINNVYTKSGKDFDMSWQQPVYVVETDIGTYISATIESQQKKFQKGVFINWLDFIGDPLPVRTNLYQGNYWINLWLQSVDCTNEINTTYFKKVKQSEFEANQIGYPKELVTA